MNKHEKLDKTQSWPLRLVNTGQLEKNVTVTLKHLKQRYGTVSSEEEPGNAIRIL
jgi:hypothetical protein